MLLVVVVVLCRLRGKAGRETYASVLAMLSGSVAWAWGWGSWVRIELEGWSVLRTGLMRVWLRVPCRPLLVVMVVWVFILNPCRFISASTEEVTEEAVEELKPTVPEEVKLGKEEEETPVAMPEVAQPEVEKAPEKVLGEQPMTRFFYALPRMASSVLEVVV